MKYKTHPAKNVVCSIVFLILFYSNAAVSQTFNFSSTYLTASLPTRLNTPDMYPIGLNIVRTKYADLDNDGIQDSVSVSGTYVNPNPGLNILYGKADGTFQPMVHLPSYILGQTVAIADINSDNRPDIVIGTWYGNYIGVFINQGNRQFAAPVFTQPPDPPSPCPSYGYPYCAEFIDFAIADFDGDGQSDLMAVQDQIDQRYRFFHFNVDGTVTVFATLNQIETNTSYERIMKVADINGDSRPDVILGGGGPFGVRNISFIFGQPAGSPLSITYGFDTVDKTVNIETNDFDNDGDQDMAVAFLDTTTPTRHSIQIYRNEGNVFFSAQPKIYLEYAFPPERITSGDYDGDGKKDIATLIGDNNGGVMVYVLYGLNNNMSFGNEAYYAAPRSQSIASIDMNRDGRTDLVTASTNGINTDLFPDYNGESNNGLGILYSSRSRRSFDGSPVLPWGPNLSAAGDFNEDGYTDMATAWKTEFNAGSTIDILLGDGQGKLIEPTFTHDTPPGLLDIKTGDFNGDGHLDIISVNYNQKSLNVYLGNGAGALATPPISTTNINSAIRKIVIFDINRDGKDDVFATGENFNADSSGYALLSNGNGSFTIAPGSPISLPQYVPFDLKSADFNADNIKDIVLNINSDNYLYLGDGQGRFVRSSSVVPSMRQIIVGDFNGDGKSDVAGLTGPTVYTCKMTVALGNGQGGFSETLFRDIPNYSFNQTQSMESGDFNRDGVSDAIMIMNDSTFGNLIVVSGSRDSGVWQQPIFYNIGTVSQTLSLGDFNRDGQLDIGYTGANSRGVILNLTFQTSSRIKAHPDFDADGKADISIYRPSSGQWWILNSQTNSVSGTTFGNAEDKVVAADYTGDGKTDIAVWRSSNGVWYTLRSEDGTFYAFPFGTSGDIPSSADFDGDGKADQSVFRPQNGVWYIHKSTGGTDFIPFGQNGDVPIASDFDGDGKADPAVTRINSGNREWWIKGSLNNTITALAFGTSEDKPVQSDFTGDGKADVAIYRPSNGYWYIVRSEDQSFYGFPFGQSEDIPSQADYDGDGKSDAAVYRPSTGIWYLQRSSQGFNAISFGLSNDVPIPGNN